MNPSLSPRAETAPSSLGSWFAGSLLDVRYAVRGMAKHARISSVAILTLALCIGVNTAIFSVVYALMLKPLPFRQADRIVSIYNNFPKIGVMKAPSSVVQYLDYQEHAASFEKLGIWMQYPCTYGVDDAMARISGSRATADMFDVLGLTPVIGRFFDATNSRPGEDKVAVLTQSFWESGFQSRPDVIGQTITVDGEKLQVIGVAPRAIEVLDARVKFLRPFAWPPDKINPVARLALGVGLFGRLKPKSSIEQALAEGTLLEKNFYDNAPPPIRGFIERSQYRLGMGTLQAERVEPYKSTLLLLQGSALFVLMIGCFNVANLMLARTNGRFAELAIRFSLGATRATIGRQLLIEALLLTVLGAATGCALGWAAIHAVNQYRARLFPNLSAFSLDTGVLAFTIAVAAVVALVVGLLPLVHVVRTNVAALLQSNSRGAAGNRSLRLFSSTLIIAQIAVAVILLTGAGLLIQSFRKALAVNPGVNGDHVVVARLALPSRYHSDRGSRSVQQQLVQRLREISGIDAVALASETPFQGKIGAATVKFKDAVLDPSAPQPTAYLIGVSVGYFETLKVALVEGRYFQDSDTVHHQTAFIVDEDFARLHFPGRSAIGEKLYIARPPQNESEWPTIVGVVRRVRHQGVEDRGGVPYIYYPLLPARPGVLSLIVRSARPAGETTAALRQAVRAIDPTMPLFDAAPLNEVISNSFTNRRAVMILLTAFAGLALFLSAIGIYGVMSYDVSQRRREIGIRGAIGASPRQLIGMFVWEGAWKSALGLVVGLGGALMLSRYMTTLLFDLAPTSPATYATAAVVLGLVALGASFGPARVAAKINPMLCLRAD